MADRGVEWHGDAALVHVRTRAIIAVRIIVIEITKRAKILLSVSGTGKVKGKRVGPVIHSMPGEPPYKQTGRLRASVTYEVDTETLTGRAGTNVDYGRWLEIGDKGVLKPRPWLRPSFEYVKARLDMILAPLNRQP